MNETTTVRITFGDDTVTMSWDPAEPSAPILVDVEPTGRQTASARHRRPLAVAIACRHAWPEALWPEVPEVGSIPDDWAVGSGAAAWDEVEYRTVTRTTASVPA